MSLLDDSTFRLDTVTIANGQSLSNAIDVPGHVLVGIVMPPTWTSANLTFQGSVDGSTFLNVFVEGGGEFQVTAFANRLIIVDPTRLYGLRSLRVRSGTSGTPVAQTADRVITLVFRQLAGA